MLLRWILRYVICVCTVHPLYSGDVAHLVTAGGDTTGRHVGAADCLDLLNGTKLLVIEDLVKVDNDLVEESDTFNSLVYVFRVELGEVWNACKQNSRIGSGNSC